MSNTQEFILTEAGFVRRTVTEELLTGAEEAIGRSMSRVAKIIPNLGVNQFQSALHLRASESEFTIASQLPYLNLATSFVPVGEGSNVYLTPDFRHSEKEVQGSVAFSPKWTPPDFVRLWFVTFDPISVLGDTEALCYLVITRTDKTGIWRLPLPNVYDDGRICTGSDQASWTRQYRNGTLPPRTCLGFHIESLNHFMVTRWNADLVSSRELTDPLFRFDLEGGQLGDPAPTSFDSCCAAVSHTFLNWLATMKGFSK